MSRFVPEDAILIKAFQLACFIHGNKRTALEVLDSSLERLETAVAAQDKRLYYTPADKHVPRRKSMRSRYKVSFSESQLLQRLIYLTSEPFEIQQELSNPFPHIGEEDMIIHFVKHLVHITLKRNSFYVALGMSRVLHDYTTGEAIEIYNAVERPDRMSDDDYYRSRKRRIMQEIRDRFGPLVGVCQGPRAEERFINQDCAGWKVKLVEQCLEIFVPWNTACLLSGTSSSGNITRFYSTPSDPDEEHSIEVDRSHALIHPNCFGTLTQGLGLDHPRMRLQIPTFFLSKSNNGNGDGPRSVRDRLPSLDEQDLSSIKQHVEERAARRRSASRGLLRVKVNGVENAQLDLERSSTTRIRLNQETDIIEVTGADRSGEMVLASHLLTYDERQGQSHPWRRSIVLEGGQKLSFNFSRCDVQEGPSTTVEITYRETNPVRALSLFFIRRRRWFSDPFVNSLHHPLRAIKPALVCALIVALAVVVYLGWERLSGSRRGTEAPLQSAASTEPASVEPSTHDRIPVGKTQDQASVKRSPEPGTTAQRRKPGLRSQDAVPDLSHAASSDEAVESERAPQPQPDALSLLQVRKICLKTVGDPKLTREIKALLTRSLQATNRFSLTDVESADAALKISVTQMSASDGSGASRRPMRMTLRLVDIGGRVIWPISGGRRNYSGPAQSIAAKFANDLTKNIRDLESGRK